MLGPLCHPVPLSPLINGVIADTPAGTAPVGYDQTVPSQSCLLSCQESESWKGGVSRDRGSYKYLRCDWVGRKWGPSCEIGRVRLRTSMAMNDKYERDTTCHCVCYTIDRKVLVVKHFLFPG